MINEYLWQYNDDEYITFAKQYIKELKQEFDYKEFINPYSVDFLNYIVPIHIVRRRRFAQLLRNIAKRIQQVIILKNYFAIFSSELRLRHLGLFVYEWEVLICLLHYFLEFFIFEAKSKYLSLKVGTLRTGKVAFFARSCHKITPL